MQSYGSKELDASLLMIPLVGFLPASDPRIRGTVAAIERELAAGRLRAALPHPPQRRRRPAPPARASFCRARSGSSTATRCSAGTTTRTRSSSGSSASRTTSACSPRSTTRWRSGCSATSRRRSRIWRSSTRRSTCCRTCRRRCTAGTRRPIDQRCPKWCAAGSEPCTSAPSVSSRASGPSETQLAHEHVAVAVGVLEAAAREQQRLAANDGAVAVVHLRRDDQVDLRELVLEQHEDDAVRRRRPLPRDDHARDGDVRVVRLLARAPRSRAFPAAGAGASARADARRPRGSSCGSRRASAPRSSARAAPASRPSARAAARAASPLRPSRAPSSGAARGRAARAARAA